MMPNHAPSEPRPSRSGCNRGLSRAGSLRLGSLAKNCYAT
jgi:hypothetical protein